MKIMDKNGRLFGKISIIDVLALLIVAVLAVSLLYKKNQVHTGSTVTDMPITFQLRIYGEYTYVADAIRVGDNLYDQNNRSNGPLGEITNIEVLGEGRRRAVLDDGSDAMIPMDNGVELLLTVRGEGILSNGRYLLNRVYNLGVNTSRDYYTPYAQFNGSITAILE